MASAPIEDPGYIQDGPLRQSPGLRANSMEATLERGESNEGALGGEEKGCSVQDLQADNMRGNVSTCRTTIGRAEGRESQ